MRHRLLPHALAALALAVPLAGCVASRNAPSAPGAATASAATSAIPAPTAPAAAPPTGAAAARAPLTSRPAPAKPFAVGLRFLALARGADRPLPTTVWYPAGGTAGGSPRVGAAAATGRFPLILLSHGLTGLPRYLAPVATRWAAAGFVVAAPAYPHTKHDAPRFDVQDVANQPADASHVITELLALGDRSGDPLEGHLEPAAVAAAGHSAGGYTTIGMLSSRRDHRLQAAVVFAGALVGGAYSGPPTPVLFVHGDADPTVSYKSGRAAYEAVPWSKAFLTLVGGDHGAYLAADGPGFDQTVRVTTDFLRWTLYGDSAAKGRLPAEGSTSGGTRWESAL